MQGFLGAGFQAFAAAGHLGGNFYLGSMALGLATSLTGPALTGSIEPPYQ